jgi:hypothetical protein
MVFWTGTETSEKCYWWVPFHSYLIPVRNMDFSVQNIDNSAISLKCVGWDRKVVTFVS